MKGWRWWLALGLLLLALPVYSIATSPVERALVGELGGRPALRNLVLPIGHRDVVTRELTIDEFEDCARRVSDWDLIIQLYSYGSGDEVVHHPALAGRSNALRDEVRDISGCMSEGVYTVVVIRDQRVVERFDLAMRHFAGDGVNLVISRDG